MFVLYRKYLICQDIVSAQNLRRIKQRKCFCNFPLTEWKIYPPKTLSVYKDLSYAVHNHLSA